MDSNFEGTNMEQWQEIENSPFEEMDELPVPAADDEEAEDNMMQMDDDVAAEEGAGFIWFLYLEPDARGSGLGGQLLGQAVYAAREQGFHQVWGPVPRSGTGESFARDYGFAPAGETAEGCPILRKDTGFDPEIWGTDH